MSERLKYGQRVKIIRGVFKGKMATVHDHRLSVLVKTDDGWCAWIKLSSIDAPTQQKDRS